MNRLIDRTNLRDSDFDELYRIITELSLRTQGRAGSTITQSELREVADLLRDPRVRYDLNVMDAVSAYATARDSGIRGPSMDILVVDVARKLLQRRRSPVLISNNRYQTPSHDDVDSIVQKVLNVVSSDQYTRPYSTNSVIKSTYKSWI